MPQAKKLPKLRGRFLKLRGIIKPTMPVPADIFPTRLSQRLTVDEVSGCWLWTGAKNPTGYGVIKVKGKQWSVHRYASTLADGEIPAGVHVLHTCDNPLCCNPAHLFRGSHKDNMADKQAKGRIVAPAAKLTPQQVQEIRSRYEAGGIRYSTLAEEYGVSKETIGAIVRTDTWHGR